MTLFDWVVVAVVAASLLLGLWRGVVGELIALVAWVLALYAALEFGAPVGRSMGTVIGDPTLRVLAGYAAVFVGVLVVMVLLRLAVQGLVKTLGLGLSDRLLGMVFGVLRGVLVVLLGVAVAGMTPAPRQSWWRQATLAPALETAVLALKSWLPADVAKRIRFT